MQPTEFLMGMILSHIHQIRGKWQFWKKNKARGFILPDLKTYYETVVILSKRANQISIAEKKELTRKLEDFKNDRDPMEEVFENREQIEISKYYERQPKPSLGAIEEFKDNEIFYRMAKQEDEE